MGLTVEQVPVDKLLSDPHNARVHSKRNIEAIANSLELFGQVRPLIVHGDTVIAGNGTLEAIKSLGWDKVSVTRVPKDWTEDQAKAYAIADNRTAEFADWDQPILAQQLIDLDVTGWDMDMLGFDSSEFDDTQAAFDEAVPNLPNGGESSGITNSNSLRDLAEKFLEKSTRHIMIEYSNEDFVWVVEAFARARQAKGLESNSAVVMSLLQEFE